MLMAASQTRLIASTVVAIVVAGASVAFLLGLPGAILVSLVAALLSPFGGHEPHGDAAWPIAIYVSFLAPFGIIASALAMSRWQPDAGRTTSIGWGAVGYFAAGIVVSLFFVFS
jgi:hypothetical protein